ncbi:Glutathione S-transferase kappa 1 [Oopsacas minuta]|uniref:Glutathione S-transferase kappa n=1 Tax=Oopsacas minuta TaxID=111878 RepID=A0AAV7K3P7_9METZ|nr:Glutathione S-transferase kappa 1 [Oopsacas minuta]
MSRTLVKLYYDIVSPYGWLGFEILCRHQHEWKIHLDLNPVFLSGLMKSTGNTPPGMVPAKAKYMNIELKRLSDFHRVPLSLPNNLFEFMFTNNNISALRLLTLVKISHPDKLEVLSREFFKRILATDEAKMDLHILQTAMETVGIVGKEASRLLEEMGTQGKEGLKKCTAEALEYGAFGVPYMVAFVGDKPNPYFGTNQIYLLADLLREKFNDKTTRSKL